MSEDPIIANTFHHSEFKDTAELVRAKNRMNAGISLAFPTLNEEATIGKEILVIKTELMDRFKLLDEIAVIDSGSTDRTRSIAEGLGARFFASGDILRKYGSNRGKGENLWKSLYALSGDIIVWIDADIRNIGPKFVTGLVGPILLGRGISYVKAFYERPFKTADGLQGAGGGRVTEILVRPLFSLFYPGLAGLVQPLSGEYAGTRELLQTLPFSVGYGVEIGHLIDIYRKIGPSAISQVNMDSRIHRNQSIQALGRMSFGIMSTFLSRAAIYGDVELMRALGRAHISISGAGLRPEVMETEILPIERPPMAEIAEYRLKFGLR